MGRLLPPRPDGKKEQQPKYSEILLPSRATAAAAEDDVAVRDGPLYRRHFNDGAGALRLIQGHPPLRFPSIMNQIGSSTTDLHNFTGSGMIGFSCPNRVNPGREGKLKNQELAVHSRVAGS
jgi:hypothetical protein